MEAPGNIESPSRGVLLGVTPFAILTAVIMFLFFDQRGWATADVIFEAVIIAICLCLILSIANARGFWWAPRVIAFIIFASYLGYVVFELFLSHKPFTMPSSRGAANPINAILGFCIFGIPCLLYSLSGSTIGPAAARADGENLSPRDVPYLRVAFAAKWVLVAVSTVVAAIGIWRAFAS
jgi:TctA family transporter